MSIKHNWIKNRVDNEVCDMSLMELKEVPVADIVSFIIYSEKSHFLFSESIYLHTLTCKSEK